MKIKKFIGLFMFVCLFMAEANAQKTVIKTNLLYDATANANVAIETRLSPHWTAEVSGIISTFAGWSI